MSKARRVPEAAVPWLTFVISLVVVAAVMVTVAGPLGLTVGPDVLREGRARIESCSRVPLSLMYSCQSTVTWAGGSATGQAGVIVTSDRLTGVVAVEEHSRLAIRGSSSPVIIPAGAPARETIGVRLVLFLVWLIASFGVTTVVLVVRRWVRRPRTPRVG